MAKDYKSTGMCNRMECFAWDRTFDNHCAALQEVYDVIGTFCPYKKKADDVDKETKRLIKETVIAKKERNIIAKDQRRGLKKHIRISKKGK